MHKYLNMYMYVSALHVYRHLRPHTHTKMCVCIYTCTCTHTYIHTYYLIHVHVHACRTQIPPSYEAFHNSSGIVSHRSFLKALRFRVLLAAAPSVTCYLVVPWISLQSLPRKGGLQDTPSACLDLVAWKDTVSLLVALAVLFPGKVWRCHWERSAHSCACSMFKNAYVYIYIEREGESEPRRKRSACLHVYLTSLCARVAR